MLIYCKLQIYVCLVITLLQPRNSVRELCFIDKALLLQVLFIHEQTCSLGRSWVVCFMESVSIVQLALFSEDSAIKAISQIISLLVFALHCYVFKGDLSNGREPQIIICKKNKKSRKQNRI
jgi:hypothetical protein